MRKHIVLVLVVILVLAVSGCAPTPAPPTKAILKGRVLVPQGAVRQVGGQALAGATVNVIDPVTGNIVATTTTDANGYYRVEVPAGGPYIIEAVKGSIKVLCVSPQVEAGETYDLGTADATSTAIALVFQARVEAGEDPAEIDPEEIKKDPKFGNLAQAVEEALAAGEDPTTAPEVTHLVDVIVSPPKPAPGPAPAPKPEPEPEPTPAPAPLPAQSTYKITYSGLEYAYPIRDLVEVNNGGQSAINTAVEAKIDDLTPIKVTLSTKVKGKSGYEAVRFSPVGAGDNIQLWAKDTNGNWYDINKVGWGPPGGFPLPPEYNETTEVYLLSNKSGKYKLTVKLVEVNENGGDEKVITEVSKEVYVVATNVEEIGKAIEKAGVDDVVYLGSGDFDTTDTKIEINKSVTLKSLVKHGAVIKGGIDVKVGGVRIEDIKFEAGSGHNIIVEGKDKITIEGCYFDAGNRFMNVPINAIELKSKCSNITINDCIFKNGYYVTINGYANNLRVTNSRIENCKSGINLIVGDNLRVEDTDISVVAKGTSNDTYCVRFADDSTPSSGLIIRGGKFSVNKGTFTADKDTYHSAIVIRSKATGTMDVWGVHIIGEVVNLSATPLYARGNRWGIGGSSVPEEDQIIENPGEIIYQ